MSNEEQPWSSGMGGICASRRLFTSVQFQPAHHVVPSVPATGGRSSWVSVLSLVVERHFTRRLLLPGRLHNMYNSQRFDTRDA
jgi:hypothetical protein